MKIVRFRDLDSKEKMGLLLEDKVFDLTTISEGKITSFQNLIKEAKGDIVSFIKDEIMSNLDRSDSYPLKELDVEPKENVRYLLKAINSPEVWAAGVTYERSREAREIETQSKSIYDKIYEAERPEVFFKATPSRHVGPYEPVGIRSDSQWNVPEPELGLVLDEKGKIVGYIIGNDMSSREIEGENPLYLPQAKVYKNCCALGPVIRLHDEGFDPNNLTIRCKIIRNGQIVYDETTNTSKLHRTFEELVEHLTRDNIIPSGSTLLTGTCLVPPDEFTLAQDDVVEITIDELGTLRNPVLQL